jgi:hypothetical protein
MAYVGQDPKVLSVFEVIASYFVDCYFNHVWHGARTHVSAGRSLTDEYTSRIQAFVTGTKNDPRCYSEVIQGVHNFFIGTTRFTTLSFAEFVDRIVGVCVPPEYFRQFSAQDKDELLSSVICDLVANLAAGTTKPDMLRRIIDEHSKTPDVTIRMMQDIAVGALITKRSALHNKFLHKMGQARDAVPLDVVEDMKKALRRLVREKTDAEARAKESENELEIAKEALKESKHREMKLRKLVELLRSGQAAGASRAGLDIIARERIPRADHTAEVGHDSRGARVSAVSDPESGSETESDTESETVSGSESVSDSVSGSETDTESASRARSGGRRTESRSGGRRTESRSGGHAGSRAVTKKGTKPVVKTPVPSTFFNIAPAQAPAQSMRAAPAQVHAPAQVQAPAQSMPRPQNQRSSHFLEMVDAPDDGDKGDSTYEESASGLRGIWD